jgi:hypothetical protein
MSAKEVRSSVDARDKMLRGVDILANAVKMRVKMEHPYILINEKEALGAQRAAAAS